MLERFRRDETGMALALAVIMIVLIGVMGAGLLVFVRNDLEAVVEVNQGQRAMDIADAGTQAAKAQLLADNLPAHYDVDDVLSQVFNDLRCNIDVSDATEAIARNPASENWSPEAGGQTRSFGGGDGRFTVTIRWMTWNPLAPSECRAPVTSLTGVLPGNADYFKVVSTGRYGNATRRVEAIYETYDLNVPKAYYTPGPVTVSGTACIDSVSIFSLSNVTFNSNGGCKNALGLPLNSHMKGTDLAYKAWAETALPTTSYSNKFNSRARPTADAGVGAVGAIEYNGGATSQLGTRDFAFNSSPRFVQAPSANPQPSNEITFPFDLGSQPDADRLCDEARAQGNYEEYTTPGNKSLTSWPANSSYTTVVCKVFTNTNSSNKLVWDVGGNVILPAPYTGCKGPIQKGTLVIRGGNFSTKSNTALFQGVVVIRGTEGTEGTDLGNSSDTGNTCLDGFVNATSEIKIAGTVRPSSSLEMNNRPGFYGVRTWSWRELYE